MGAWKSTCGAPAFSSPRCSTLTTIKSLSPERKKSSLPLCPHNAWSPPLVEICTFLVRPGKSCTYTSDLPVSSEEYASQRPSGENVAWVWLKGAERKGCNL